MLASLNDVYARLRDADAEHDDERIAALLAEASALVVAYLGYEPDPVPEAVTLVTSRMVARVLEAPEPSFAAESTSYTAGPFAKSVSYSAGASGGAPWLTAADKQILGSFRKRVRGGIYSMTMR